MYVTDEQVDEAAQVIERRMRKLAGEGPAIFGRYLADECVFAACDIQQLWGLG